MVELRAPSADFRAVAAAGYLTILFCLGGGYAWAAMARLDSAVVARATVSLESHRKVVEHLEGGIIKEILVKEGAAVNEGQPLFRLDDTQSRATMNLLSDQLDECLAQEARLEAERTRAATITFPQELASRMSDPSVKKIVDGQTAQFTDRRNSIESQVALLKGRVEQLREEIEGLRREGDSAQEQLYFIKDELEGVRELTDKGLVPKTRRNSLEREKARLDGVVGRNQVDDAKARSSIGEVQLQIDQLYDKMQEEVATSLQDTRQKIRDVREKLRVAQDTEMRTVLRAPRSGIVQNMRASTIGEVLKPGESLLEIVPLDEQLIVSAEVQPNDVQDIHDNATAEVRFPSFRSRTTPVILGKLRTISHDQLIDETSHQPYFLARIAISDTDVPAILRERLRAGMQAEVVFPTGQRTVMDYLVHPLIDAFSETFRER